MAGGMNMKEIIEKIYNIDVIEKIKSGLVDNASKDIFDARIQYMLNGDTILLLFYHLWKWILWDL